MVIFNNRNALFLLFADSEQEKMVSVLLDAEESTMVFIDLESGSVSR